MDWSNPLFSHTTSQIRENSSDAFTPVCPSGVAVSFCDNVAQACTRHRPSAAPRKIESLVQQEGRDCMWIHVPKENKGMEKKGKPPEMIHKIDKT